MPLSWHTMLEFEPSLVGCVVSATSYSLAILSETGQCVLNVPTVELAEQVAAPLVAECHANLECRVADCQLVGSYNFFILEVVQAWYNPSVSAPCIIAVSAGSW